MAAIDIDIVNKKRCYFIGETICSMYLMVLKVMAEMNGIFCITSQRVFVSLTKTKETRKIMTNVY